MQFMIPKPNYFDEVTDIKSNATGKMPKALQTYLGVFNWSDLTDQTITAIDGTTKTGINWLKNFSDVGISADTVGWSFEDGAVQNCIYRTNDNQKICIMAKLYNFDGYSDYIFVDKGQYKKFKYWEHYSNRTTMPSGVGKAIIIDETTGDVALGTTIPMEFGASTIIRRLATPIVEEVALESNFATFDKLDNFIYETANKVETLTTNGVDTVFSHTLGTAIFDIYVNGKLSQATKTTTTVTFANAPRRADIVELVAKKEGRSIAAGFNLYEPEGLETEIDVVDEISISEQKIDRTVNYADYSHDYILEDTKYLLTLTMPLVKNERMFKDKYTGKKFRLKLVDEDNKVSYYSNCEIIEDSSLNNQYIENVTIRATDYYEGD